MGNTNLNYTHIAKIIQLSNNGKSPGRNHPSPHIQLLL